jgi:hypothetical protein
VLEDREVGVRNLVRIEQALHDPVGFW